MLVAELLCDGMFPIFHFLLVGLSEGNISCIFLFVRHLWIKTCLACLFRHIVTDFKNLGIC